MSSIISYKLGWFLFAFLFAKVPLGFSTDLKLTAKEEVQTFQLAVDSTEGRSISISSTGQSCALVQTRLGVDAYNYIKLITEKDSAFVLPLESLESGAIIEVKYWGNGEIRISEISDRNANARKDVFMDSNWIIRSTTLHPAEGSKMWVNGTNKSEGTIQIECTVGKPGSDNIFAVAIFPTETSFHISVELDTASNVKELAVQGFDAEWQLTDRSLLSLSGADSSRWEADITVSPNTARTNLDIVFSESGKWVVRSIGLRRSKFVGNNNKKTQ
jgi:hypothetical protein